MIKKKNKKHSIILFLISIFFLAILFLTVNNPNSDVNLDSTEISVKQEEYTLKKPLIAAPGNPNLTRVNYPIVLSNETATELWTALHNLSVDDFRIAYYSMEDKWELVPFQLDEKGYFRSFRYNFGSQVETYLAKIDLTNWGQYVAEKHYAGKDIDANETAAYKEPTKYECELGFWPTRLAENWANSSLPVGLEDNDTSTDPGRPDPAPTLDPREAPGGIWDQLERRVDYDDEVVFYAQNGKKAGVENWNLTRLLNRYEIELFDPVDGGQSWMYLYYNASSTVQNPTTNFFTPGGEDFVSWDKTNLKVTGQNYEYTINVNNKDLGSNATVNLPGSSPSPLFSEVNKQWIAVNLRVIQIAEVAPGPPPVYIDVFDLNDSADIWREGEWGYPPNRILYNEQNTSIGYNIKMDLDLEKLNKWFPGQDNDYNNSHRHTGVGGQSHGKVRDTYTNGVPILSLVLSYSDDGDHDNVTDAEYAPFVRGIVDDSAASNEAAIDGPCRVVIDKFSVSVFTIDLGGLNLLGNPAFPLDFGYEEYWSIARSTSKFYANMTAVDPIELTTNYSTGDPEQQIIAQLHYGFLAGQNFTTNVRNDPEAYILLGQAPYGDAGLPNLTQCGHENKSWPLKIYPDGDGSNDGGGTVNGLVSGGGPQAGHYDNTSLVTPSKESAPGAGDGNPLSDWQYVHTSGGGAWTYIPYNETWKLFTKAKYRDVAYYWNDNENFTEMAVYGNHGDKNGKTDFFPARTVFGNFTEWECKREYARMKLRLEDNMILRFQSLDLLAPTWDPQPEDVKVQLGADFTYTVHAYDLNGIKEYSINDTTNFTIDSVSGEITNNTALSLGDYQLMINASDYSQNIASAIITITVEGPGDPVWLIEPKDQQVELGDSFIYTVTASDSDGIKKYWINDTANFFIYPDNGTIINNTALVVSDYELNISVCDNKFYNTSAIITITVVDTTSPTWDEEPTDQTAGYLLPFNYEVNASDLSDIKYSINDMTNFTIDSDSGEITNNTILSFGVNYGLMINASDFFNNNISKIITITVADLTKPFWVVVPTNQTVRIVEAEGNTAKLSYDVDANDIIGIKTYWINDTAFFDIDNDGLITSDVLRLGIYKVEIRAYDDANNYCSAIITVTVLRELETVKTYKDDVEEISSEKVPILDIYIGFAIVMISSAAALVISMILIKRR